MSKSMFRMCVVNLTLGIFAVFFLCDHGLYLTVAYSIMTSRCRSGRNRIGRIDRLLSAVVNVEDDQPPVTKKTKSKKSISFVPSLATLVQQSSSPSSPPSSHYSSNDLIDEQLTGDVVLDVDVLDDGRSSSITPGPSGTTKSPVSNSNSSSIGELIMSRNRQFLESLKLRKDAIEIVLSDPRISSSSSSSSSNSSSNACVSLDIEDRWLQLRDSIGMTRATLKLYASQYPTLAVDILATPVKTSKGLLMKTFSLTEAEYSRAVRKTFAQTNNRAGPLGGR